MILLILEEKWEYKEQSLSHKGIMDTLGHIHMDFDEQHIRNISKKIMKILRGQYVGR